MLSFLEIQFPTGAKPGLYAVLSKILGGSDFRGKREDILEIDGSTARTMFRGRACAMF